MAFRRAMSNICCSPPQNLLINSRPISHSALQSNYRLTETIRGLDINRFQSDHLVRAPGDREGGESIDVNGVVMSLKEMRKVLRASEMEAARSRLRAMSRSCITHSDFLNVCAGVSAAADGSDIARRLDNSGDVIVLGNVVYLRPDQVAKAISEVLPMSMNHNKNNSRMKEVKQMEEMKAEIDQKAEAHVKRELWCGLGFLALQTLGFLRLTFWELSWDVMEPICFFTTSTYFMAGYGFFLRTSREPSFEGLFASRFASKQRRLMQAYRFDLKRFNELKQAAGSACCSENVADCSSSYSDCHKR